jgi:hypothetical protein
MNSTSSKTQVRQTQVADPDPGIVTILEIVSPAFPGRALLPTTQTTSPPGGRFGLHDVGQINRKPNLARSAAKAVAIENEGNAAQ